MQLIYYIYFYKVEKNGELGELLDCELCTTVNEVYEHLKKLDDNNISVTLEYSKQELNSKLEEGLARGDEHLLDFFYEDGRNGTPIYVAVESELVEDGYLGINF